MHTKNHLFATPSQLAQAQAGAPAPPSAAQLAAQNAQARNLVLAAGVPRFQQIASTSVDPTTDPIITINPKNVGLIRGFFVEVSGSIINSDAGVDVATRTPFGVANMLSNIQFQDMDNVTRINAPGWLLSLINSAKQPLVMGGAYAPNVPMGYGNNWDVEVGPATIAKGVTSAIRMVYYVPLAYTKLDLRGAMWAGVVNSTAQLQLTINQSPLANAGDYTNAIYSGADAGGWSGNVSVTVYQDYIDQIPYMQGQPVLPAGDLGQTYNILQTAMSGLVSGQDYGIPYANFRSFLSTTVVVDNGVTPFLNNGDEINYFALQAANASQLFKYGPNTAAFMARNVFAADPPLGTYFFSHRDRPITTQQFGNMELIVNPNGNINAAASLLVGFEFFAQLNQVTFATSLPNN